jgi:hypothetical protein
MDTKEECMDWDKMIFSLAVAGIGVYAVYLKEATIAGMCIGIMGAILRPGTPQPPNTSSTISNKQIDPNAPDPNAPAPL